MKARRLAVLLGFGLSFSASALFAEMYKENVVASFYADKFNGRRTASGEIFDTNGYTAAHKTLPFGTVVKVTNLDNGKSVNVRVNDRGPFVQGREIDVSKAAAMELGMLEDGNAKVSLEIVDEEEGPASASFPAASPYEDYEEEGGAEDEDEYAYGSPASSEADGTGFGFAPPPVSGGMSGGPDSPYADYSEEAAEAEPPVQPEKKEAAAPAAKKETKTVTTTTTTTTTTTSAAVVETAAKRWDIQLGAFSNEGNAKVMAHRLLQAGFDNVAYQKVGDIIRVVLREIDEADLDKFQTKLDQSGFSSYIVRERKNIIKKD